MERSYRYWKHENGDTFAVRLEGGRLTGLCGPLHYSEVQARLLPWHHYDDHPDGVEWTERFAYQFELLEVA